MPLTPPRNCLALLACSLLARGLRDQAPATPASHAAFAQSLALRLDRVVADLDCPVVGWLAQIAPVAYTSKGALRLKVALAPWADEVKAVKDLARSRFTAGTSRLRRFRFPPICAA